MLGAADLIKVEVIASHGEVRISFISLRNQHKIDQQPLRNGPSDDT